MNQLKITTSTLSCHPVDTSEGSTKLLHCADSSLSLRMTPAFFEFLIRKAL